MPLALMIRILALAVAAAGLTVAVAWALPTWGGGVFVVPVLLVASLAARWALRR